jgi:2-polyprenyl-3-methyl-5-hydroxy-6-metoxy-1,4-benzoquinol methylase
MTNIFEIATEFIDLDCRQTRVYHPTTVETVYKKCQVQLPKNLIEDKTILDLGSALGAAGHYALTNGAKHYTGVELQNYYVDHSNILLKKYWDSDKFVIVQQEIEDFLDEKIAQNKKYDYVLAAGVIYCFLNMVSILDKLCKITREAIVIETINYPDSAPGYGSIGAKNIDPNDSIKKYGEILVTSSQPMVKSVDDTTNDIYYEGIASRISINALDIIMSTNSFNRTEEILLPEKFENSYDPFREQYHKFENDKQGPLRYIARYFRGSSVTETLKDAIIKGDSVDINKKSWVFDDSVAKRFQHEAETNIPSYHLVIDKCLLFANKYLQKTDKVIDVGSALGYTISKFINAGFTNVMGVDNSTAMIDKSMHKQLVLCDDKLPKYKYKLVMMNWTLHFVTDKTSYLIDIYNSLEDTGYLILSDKCLQSDIVKDMYYDFKRSHGVSEEYIRQKEHNLIGVMKSVHIQWYLEALSNIGFKVEVIHADLGFVTFLCTK